MCQIYKIIFAILFLSLVACASNLPSLQIRVIGDGNPVSNALVFVRYSQPDCMSNNDFSEIGRTNYDGVCDLSNFDKKLAIKRLCSPCRCWHCPETNVEVRVSSANYQTAEILKVFNCRSDGYGGYSYQESYSIDVFVDRSASTSRQIPKHSSSARFENNTPPLPGKGYYAPNGNWHENPNYSPDPNMQVKLIIRLYVKSIEDGTSLKNISHYYRWGDKVECTDRCVIDNGSVFSIVLGNNPPVYRYSDYPKNFHVYLKRPGFREFEADIPISSILAREEIVTIFMQPLN